MKLNLEPGPGQWDKIRKPNLTVQLLYIQAKRV